MTTECQMTDSAAATYEEDENGCTHLDPESWIRTTHASYIENGLLSNLCLICKGDMNEAMYVAV